MKEIVQFMKSLGFSAKELHEAKSCHKVQKLAKYYGYKQAPVLKKEYANKLIKEYLSLEHKNSESFRLIYEKYIARQINYYGPQYEKLDEHKLTICNLPAKKFYQSPEWREIRYKVLKNNGNKCCACGKSPSDGIVIHVDHILPRSVFPKHALRYDNLQVLCEDCNLGKSNKDLTDWR